MSHFNSRRSAVVARNGMVATSQPLASQAGLEMLKNGGNAVDAAVATAAALNVLEPMSTGIGGDVFALIWMASEKKVVAINGSGRSALGANPEDVKNKGYIRIPNEGPDAAFSVSVPGTVDGWQKCLSLYGRMTLSDTLKPAISYAEDGYGVSEIIASQWNLSVPKLKQRPSGAEMLKNGKAPRHGDVMRLPELGNTLRRIAESGPEEFYKGEIAKKISDFVQSEGGWITEEDMSAHHSDIDEPISIDYRGVKIWECPPNGSGIAALMALNILEGFEVDSMGPQSADWYHHSIESMRLGYSDALQYVADPRVTNVPTHELLSSSYANERRNLIHSNQAMQTVDFGEPFGNSDTVYVTAVDGDGNACSLINSLFHGFGSGLIVPDTGIALQNRGSLFSFDSSHPNYLTGGKRPYQTIIPAMATRDNEMWLSFGVMGGFQQPQGHLQVISNMVDFGMTAQETLDSLRFSIDIENSGEIRVEEDIDPTVVAELRKRGHDVVVVSGEDRIMFGGAQLISRDPHTGVLMGGSEPRKDGAAIGW
ncbi:MAG: gamma-glutamyltransferase [Chloroflexi bacterium]|nr:gamma-glutamyltransferase [Chloroflexota bacterium]|tara:strand:- start:1064 stop:2677 length:1614 start_codon:yes stop_codon:yes gene_type:complete